MPTFGKHTVMTNKPKVALNFINYLLPESLVFTCFSKVGIELLYRIEGYFPEVQIFLNGEPLALAEIFPIQKFPNLVP